MKLEIRRDRFDRYLTIARSKYIPRMRDIRITVNNDGQEVDITEHTGAIEIGPEAEPTDRPDLPWVTCEYEFRMTPEQSERLRYWLVVRPRLYCPLEYRLN